jgi:pimeloyl-ACP methyl ester carboxylesterase
MVERSRTQYARNGDVHLAFQVVGEGALDLLLIDTWVHHVEAVWDFPDFARFLRRLSSLGRLIHFDRRGTGLSDPVPLDQLPDLQTQVGDAVAVLKAAQSGGAAVVGLNDGTIVAVLLAAAHPQLCRSLVLFTLTSAHTPAAGMPMESIDEALELIQASAVTDDSGWSSTLAAQMGDRRWRDVLDQHHELGRGELARFGGREVSTTGDGFRGVRPSDRGGAVRPCHGGGDGVAAAPDSRRRSYRGGRGAWGGSGRVGRPYRGPDCGARRQR